LISQIHSNTDPTTEAVRDVLRNVLGLGTRAQALMADTPLLGDLPELDSMAVATVLTGLEERFDIIINDDDISAESFESFGNLVEMVRSKENAG
jgi:acyl carrier protein